MLNLGCVPHPQCCLDIGQSTFEKLFRHQLGQLLFKHQFDIKKLAGRLEVAIEITEIEHR